MRRPLDVVSSASVSTLRFGANVTSPGSGGGAASPPQAARTAIPRASAHRFRTIERCKHVWSRFDGAAMTVSLSLGSDEWSRQVIWSDGPAVQEGTRRGGII